jgi:hypothetical protein
MHVQHNSKLGKTRQKTTRHLVVKLWADNFNFTSGFSASHTAAADVLEPPRHSSTTDTPQATENCT